MSDKDLARRYHDAARNIANDPDYCAFIRQQMRPASPELRAQVARLAQNVAPKPRSVIIGGPKRVPDVAMTEEGGD